MLYYLSNVPFSLFYYLTDCTLLCVFYGVFIPYTRFMGIAPLLHPYHQVLFSVGILCPR